MGIASTLPVQNDGIAIRRAGVADVESIAVLLGHLGYPTLPSELEHSLRGILDSCVPEVFLAVLNGSKVVGLISLLSFPVLRLKGFQVSIEELVVHPDHRAVGIGGRLVQFAVEYARQKGAMLVEVLTNSNRESFKRGFYEKNGFSPSNHSVFRLRLSEGSLTVAP